VKKRSQRKNAGRMDEDCDQKRKEKEKGPAYGKKEEDDQGSLRGGRTGGAG